MTQLCCFEREENPKVLSLLKAASVNDGDECQCELKTE